MANRTMTIGMRDYDHTRALADGRVKIDGVDLKFVNIIAAVADFSTHAAR